MREEYELAKLPNGEIVIKDFYEDGSYATLKEIATSYAFNLAWAHQKEQVTQQNREEFEDRIKVLDALCKVIEATR